MVAITKSRACNNDHRDLDASFRPFGLLKRRAALISLVSLAMLLAVRSVPVNSAESSPVQPPPAQATNSAQAANSAQGPVQATPSSPPSAKNDDQNVFRPRLPMYYAKVVDEKQRQKIYDIQRKYHPQIADLQKQLEKLIAQRDAEIEAVLTPQQKAEIEKLRQEASQRRKEKSDAGSSAEANPPSQQ